MHIAVLLGLATLVLYGLWTVAAKLSTQTVSPALTMALSYGTGSVIALSYVIGTGALDSVDRRGLAFGVLAGLCAGAGGIAFYTGLSKGRASIVTTISGLYFVVTVLLGYLVLDESLTLTNVAGVGFAVVAVLLLAQ